jgi:hypothetical protein
MLQKNPPPVWQSHVPAQFVYPGSHVYWQVPALQVGTVFGTLHALPHEPQ